MADALLVRGGLKRGFHLLHSHPINCRGGNADSGVCQVSSPMRNNLLLPPSQSHGRGQSCAGVLFSPLFYVSLPSCSQQQLRAQQVRPQASQAQQHDKALTFMEGADNCQNGRIIWGKAGTHKQCELKPCWPTLPHRPLPAQVNAPEIVSAETNHVRREHAQYSLWHGDMIKTLKTEAS